MSRFYRIDLRTWDSSEFRNLSPLPAGGQALWLYLLSANQPALVPGVCLVGRLSLAERLGWQPEAVDQAMQELTREKLAWVHWPARLLWAPKVTEMNRPDNPNIAKAWARALEQLPPCDLSEAIREWTVKFLAGLGEGFERVARSIEEPSTEC